MRGRARSHPPSIFAGHRYSLRKSSGESGPRMGAVASVRWHIRPGTAMAMGALFGAAFAVAVWKVTPPGSSSNASPSPYGSPSPSSTSPAAAPTNAASSSHVPGGPQYTTDTTPLVASPGGGAVVTLTPATPLRPLGVQGTYARVGLDVYRSPDSPTILYQDPSTLSRAGVLVSPGAAQQTGTATVAGSTWQRVHVVGWVARGATSGDLNALWSQASSLYGTSCGTCHSAHNSTEYTGRQWVGQFKAMVPKTSLSPGEAALVLKWLQAHAATP
jgi:hypothetical protein